MQTADPEHVAEVIAQRRGTRDLLLLSDFDGTLAEFQADPAAVQLPERVQALIGSLTSAAGTAVGIVSGRRAADVRKRSGLTREQGFAAGLHGLEIDGPAGVSFVHPEIAAARGRVHVIAAELRPLAASLPGAFVEDKELSVALHFREASPRDQEFAADSFDRLVEPAVAAGEVRVMRGACVREVLPAIAWTKGHAVTWIRQHVASASDDPFTVYIGDDVTDEDAFWATHGHGLSIAASDRVGGADYRLHGPADIERLLIALRR